MKTTKDNECVNGFKLGDEHPFIRCSIHGIPQILTSIYPEQWRCQKCRDEYIQSSEETR